MKMPSLSHWVLTNSNCRLRWAPAKTKMIPRSIAVVLEHAVGQHRPVAGAASDHPVQPDVDAALLVQRVARVGPAGVGADRALEAAGVVAEDEVVVASRVAPELGVVAGRARGRGARRSASADHLRAEEVLLRAGRRPVAQVAPVGRHLRVQLAEHDVGAVATQHVRGRHRRQLAGLVGVAEDDLAGLERPLARVRGRSSAPLDGGLADAVLEPERRPPGGELVAVLPPDQLDAGQLGMGLAGPAPRPLGAGPRRRRGPRWRRARRCCRAAAPSGRGRSRRRRPELSARAAMPCRNSGAKLSSDSCGTPSASSPW